MEDIANLTARAEWLDEPVEDFVFRLVSERCDSGPGFIFYPYEGERPEWVAPEYCSSFESRTEHFQNYPETHRRGAYFQAAALGIELDTHIRRSIDQSCVPIVEFVRGPAIVEFGAQYELVWCKAAWWSSCEESAIFSVDDARYQFCRLEYDENGRGDTDVLLTPRVFLPDEPELTRRFRSYRMTLTAEGGGLLDQTSGKITVSQIRVMAVHLQMTDAERRRFGCVIPPAELRRMAQDSVPLVITGREEPNLPQSYVVRFENRGSVPSTSGYRLEVFDSDWGTGDSSGRWLRKGAGQVTVNGNSSQEIPFTQYGATKWRLNSWHIR